MIFRTFVVAVLGALALASCDSPTAPLDPGDASYAVDYNPVRLVSTIAECDRLFTHAIVSLGRKGHSFSLSANFMDDCSRIGGGYAYWEVYFAGHYALVDTTVAFTPDPGLTPPFVGTFDGTYIRLTLPARPDSMALVPIPVQLGPKEPF
jgi:hypothetical protein